MRAAAPESVPPPAPTPVRAETADDGTPAAIGGAVPPAAPHPIDAPAPERTPAAIGGAAPPAVPHPIDAPAPERTPAARPAPPSEVTHAPPSEVTYAPRSEVTPAPPSEATPAPRSEVTHTPPSEVTYAPRSEVTPAPPSEATHAPDAIGAPSEAPGGGEDDGILHLLAEEGLLAARDLDEVREWIFEGRVWPDNLVFVPGQEALRADRHPLTRDLFVHPRETAEGVEEKPEPPEEVSGLETQAAGTAVEVAPGTAPASAPSAEAAEDLWPAPPAETEVDVAALRSLLRRPAGVRALGVLNALLSLTLPPNPLGLVAAFGLLRGRAWGRTLTTVWAGLQIVFLLIVWSGVTALLLARGVVLPADFQALRATGSLAPLALGLLAFGALGAYFVVQWSYLARPDVAARFGGRGERPALWAGWILGWLYVGAVAFATLFFMPRLAGWPPLAALLPEAPAPIAAPVATPRTPPAPRSARVYGADGRVSIEVPPQWTVTAVDSGPEARLGVLLQGSREDPPATVRVSAARAEDIDRLNRRFDKLEGDERTIQSVEDISLGDLVGRRIVLSSKVRGGVTGQVLLSLHDDTRGYQFSCAATGPGFDRISDECDRMAQSLVIVRTPAAGGEGGSAAPGPAAGAKGGAAAGAPGSGAAARRPAGP